MGFEGGTGKAEDAKLPGAGISAKPCPRKCVAEKEQVPTSVKSVCRATARQPLGAASPSGVGRSRSLGWYKREYVDGEEILRFVCDRGYFG